MLPVLWSMYDESGAEKVTPLELHRNRRYIRYLYLNGPWLSGIHYPTNLRRLCISSRALLESAALIQLNPQLIELDVRVDGHFKSIQRGAPLEIYLEFSDDSDDEIGADDEEEVDVRRQKIYTFNDIHLVLETLSGLRNLTLSYCDLSDLRPLLEFVRSNPGLTHLTLEGIRVLERPVGYAPLTSVTHLFLPGTPNIGGWQACPYLPDLIRLCPNLESLAFAQGQNFDSSELARSIRSFCPKLTSIESLNSIVCLRDCPLSSPAAVELIKSPVRLVHYEVACSAVTSGMLTALLQHADSLQAICLYVVDDSVESFTTSGKILSSFPNLRSFALNLAPFKRYQNNGWGFFDQIWNCPRLERISLMSYFPWFQDTEELEVVAEANKGFKTRNTGLDGVSEASGSTTSDGRGRTGKKPKIVLPERHPASDKKFCESMAKLGWAYKKEFDPYDLDSKKKPLTYSTRATRNKLFERLAHLPHMRDIELPYVRYVKL
ncbi:hypothetical protein CPC16_011349 [Podila verticillata]|nr:hypothetical protein CPC16_011349 [Podila verticillata]